MSVQLPDVTYMPADCCMCRWIVWNEDCGHPESDGLDSPHNHCAMHGGLTADQMTVPLNCCGSTEGHQASCETLR